jgi:hypothetical protein
MGHFKRLAIKIFLETMSHNWALYYLWKVSVIDCEESDLKRGRVVEILNSKRKLNLEMRRKHHETLGIPTEVLLKEY